MLFARVTDKEQEELKEAIKEAKEAKWYRRLKIVDLSSQGHRVPALAEMFDIGEGRVREYIKQYNEGGHRAIFLCCHGQCFGPHNR